jgi:hypothetical protein
VTTITQVLQPSPPTELLATGLISKNLQEFAATIKQLAHRVLVRNFIQGTKIWSSNYSWVAIRHSIIHCQALNLEATKTAARDESQDTWDRTAHPKPNTTGTSNLCACSVGALVPSEGIASRSLMKRALPTLWPAIQGSPWPTVKHVADLMVWQHLKLASDRMKMCYDRLANSAAGRGVSDGRLHGLVVGWRQQGTFRRVLGRGACGLVVGPL